MTADTCGLFTVDTELLRAVNSVDDVTISTLPNHYPVSKNSRLASMRIIPLVTHESNIIMAERLCNGKKLLSLMPYKLMKAGIIITGSEIYHGLIHDKFEAVARKKLANYPCEILGVSVCDDDPEMLNDTITSYLTQNADIIIMSGGMSVDPDDLTPSAIARTGAEIISYGVPSQPGNMTMLAYLNDTALIGVPGAAIMMPVTVFDVLLPQIFTGLKFTRDDLISLGDGGLCHLCAECHFPNCTFGGHMSVEFRKYIDTLSKLRFGKMFRNDFFLTWEKTDDEIKAVWTVADILRNLRERNISTKVFDSGLGISLFRDNSTRTRFSFTSACNLLGLEVQELDEKKSQVAHGETVRETANMISFMADVIGIRDDMYIGKGNKCMHEVADAVEAGYRDGILEQRPTLVNLQCDIDHPTQCMADALHALGNGRNISLP